MSTSTTTATFSLSAIFLLLSSALCVFLFRCDLMRRWVPILGFLVLAGVALLAARATVLAWITVLVLLAFAGNRRRVLVKQGREITADVAMYFAGVVVKKRGLAAVAFAAVCSFVAVVRSTEIDQRPVFG